MTYKNLYFEAYEGTIQIIAVKLFRTVPITLGSVIQKNNNNVIVWIRRWYLWGPSTIVLFSNFDCVRYASSGISRVEYYRNGVFVFPWKFRNYYRLETMTMNEYYIVLVILVRTLRLFTAYFYPSIHSLGVLDESPSDQSPVS